MCLLGRHLRTRDKSLLLMQENIVIVRAKQGNYAMALQLENEVLATRAKVLDSAHPKTAKARMIISQLQKAMQNAP